VIWPGLYFWVGLHYRIGCTRWTVSTESATNRRLGFVHRQTNTVDHSFCTTPPITPSHNISPKSTLTLLKPHALSPCLLLVTSFSTCIPHQRIAFPFLALQTNFILRACAALRFASAILGSSADMSVSAPRTVIRGTWDGVSCTSGGVITCMAHRRREWEEVVCVVRMVWAWGSLVSAARFVLAVDGPRCTGWEAATWLVGLVCEGGVGGGGCEGRSGGSDGPVMLCTSDLYCLWLDAHGGVALAMLMGEI
jgi:hypothetical protein